MKVSVFPHLLWRANLTSIGTYDILSCPDLFAFAYKIQTIQASFRKHWLFILRTEFLSQCLICALICKLYPISRFTSIGLQGVILVCVVVSVSANRSAFWRLIDQWGASILLSPKGWSVSGRGLRCCQSELAVSVPHPDLLPGVSLVTGARSGSWLVKRNSVVR